MKKYTGKLILLLLLIVSLTGCGGKKDNNSNKEFIPYEKTKQELNTEIDDLITKENEIIAANKEAWDKVFAHSNKQEAKNKDYYDYLSESFENAKKDLSQEEADLISKDLEKIKSLEEEIKEKTSQLDQAKDSSESGQEKQEGQDSSKEKFPEFTAKDFAGKDLNSDIFKESAVTVLNFWSNGCVPCINEMPKLDKLNDSLKEKGGQVIGVNADMISGDEQTLKDAQEILDGQKVKYQNIYFDSQSEAWQVLLKTSVFPTTLVINRNGEVVGEPITGSIDNDKLFEILNQRIDQVLTEDSNK